MVIFAVTIDHQGHAVGFPLHPFGGEFHNRYLSLLYFVLDKA